MEIKIIRITFMKKSSYKYSGIGVERPHQQSLKVVKMPWLPE